MSTTTTTPSAVRLNGLALLPAPIIALGLLLALIGGFSPLPLLIGAAGWLAALVLRQPVALLAAKRFGQERAATIVGWFSGPAEELVRVVLVVLTLHAVKDAVWFGFGWAAVEVLVVAVNVFAIAGLLTKDDPKSVEARELLQSQGMLRQVSPVWGFVERLSAIALHLGFTLLLFANPWLVLVTLPAHSLINMLTVRFAKRSVVLSEAALAVVGAAALVGGLLAVGLLS